MKTTSVMLQTLCTPCGCRCRYCLLSWDGEIVGAPYERSERYALRFHEWIKAERPDIGFNFSWGCSMEHPRLFEALDFLSSIGSIGADYLQCDGMKMRSDAELESFIPALAAHGVKHLNFTFYGLPEYHDRFASRSGDFEYLLRFASAAVKNGLEVSAGIPLTGENAGMIDPLLAVLHGAGIMRITLLIPHAEGRGVNIEGIRATSRDLDKLSPEARALLNGRIFKPESVWVREKPFIKEENRTLLISLTPDNIERFESMPFGDVISEIEALDDAYYAAFPELEELADTYGDPESDRLFRQRDLFAGYRKMYMEEHGISVYDVTDERFCGSRRY
ncbi:MAG: hypothetical protein K6G56_05060 [Clostridiales bacterium]|nr:hypothetical protein [Clostridiales bacterium]